MGQETVRKTGNLSLERGGQYGRRGVRIEIEVEREVRARVYAAGFRSKAFLRITRNETHPTRKLAELHREAKRLRASYEDVRALFIEPLEDDLMQMYGRTPPSAA